MSWHVDAATMERYTRGALPDAPAFSVETHVVECAECRERMKGAVDQARLARMWLVIEDRIRMPRPGVAERLLLAVGVKEHTARLLSATPSLSLSWFVAVALVLSFAVAAGHAAESGFVLFLLAAPLLPLAGVAAAYGPGVDPTYEIGLAAPMRGFDLLLARAAAVLVCTVSLGTVAALALPGLEWVPVAWLLPSVALVGSCLALTTALPPVPAAAIVALAWAAVVAVSIAVTPSTAALQHLFAGAMQIVLLGLTVMSSVAVMARRWKFEEGVL